MEFRAFLMVLFISVFDGAEGRIVPYRAVIEYKGDAFCAGSVIDSLWVLTAAKCVMNKTVSYLTVRLGSRFSKGESSLYGVKSTDIHPKYNPETSRRGFALLRLSAPLKLSTRLAPITLVKPGYGMEEGTRCTIPGTTVTNSSTDVKAKLWSREKCETAINRNSFNLTDDALCAKISEPFNNNLTCSDADHQQHQQQQRFMLGSPLVCEGKQVAVVSHYSASASLMGQCDGGGGDEVSEFNQYHQRRGSLPDFFTDVAFGDQWISSHLVKKRRKPSGNKRVPKNRLSHHRRNGTQRRKVNHLLTGVMVTVIYVVNLL